MTKAFVFAGNDTVGNMVADRLCGAGWQRVGDAGAADAVLTYFTTQTALEDAYFGDNGIVQGARKGTLLIDLSCTTPTFARELNAMACVADLVAVEAPLVVTDVAVPDAFAARENLGCFVGGEEDCVEAAREVPRPAGRPRHRRRRPGLGPACPRRVQPAGDGAAGRRRGGRCAVPCGAHVFRHGRDRGHARRRAHPGRRRPAGGRHRWPFRRHLHRGDAHGRADRGPDRRRRCRPYPAAGRGRPAPAGASWPSSAGRTRRPRPCRWSTARKTHARRRVWTGPAPSRRTAIMITTMTMKPTGTTISAMPASWTTTA